MQVVYFRKQSHDPCKKSSWCVKCAVQAAQEKRLNLGVELYGFQQQLAQLQKTCQETESKAAQLAAEREREEPVLVGLREQAAKNAKDLVARKAEVRRMTPPSGQMSGFTIYHAETAPCGTASIVLTHLVSLCCAYGRLRGLLFNEPMGQPGPIAGGGFPGRARQLEQ